jgi:hypothetical protein
MATRSIHTLPEAREPPSLIERSITRTRTSFNQGKVGLASPPPTRTATSKEFSSSGQSKNQHNRSDQSARTHESGSQTH